MNVAVSLAKRADHCPDRALLARSPMNLATSSARVSMWNHFAKFDFCTANATTTPLVVRITKPL